MFEKKSLDIAVSCVEIECYLKVEGRAFMNQYARAISSAKEDKTRRSIFFAREMLRFLVRSRGGKARMAGGDTDNKKSWDIK
jgi:hypothetical protein